MRARGFTLVEILVALVIMVMVSSGVLMVFQNQSRNAGTQRAVVEMNLMAKGASEELTRTLRMAGGMLPPQSGGLKVKGGGTEAVTVALNRNAGVDTTRASAIFVMGNATVAGQSFDNALILPVRHVAGVFTDRGYILTTVRLPPASYPAATFPAPVRDSLVVLPVLALSASASYMGLPTGPVVVADGSWFASRWPWANSVQVDVNTFVYALDSVRYFLRSDTLFRQVDRNDTAPYAVGIDSLRIQYLHPNGNWYDSTWGGNPANQIEKVRISLKVRTRQKDNALARNNPATRGYHYQTIVNEVALRNSETLVNQ